MDDLLDCFGLPYEPGVHRPAIRPTVARAVQVSANYRLKPHQHVAVCHLHCKTWAVPEKNPGTLTLK